MSLIICEGVDRVGKSTVASYFETLGFEVIHMSAPAKHHTSDSFLQEMIDLVTSASIKDIFLDRSYYGEACVWPEIYNRKPLLDEESLEILREIEESVGAQRIWMTDNSIEAHWKRCVDNKEPLTKVQFTRARALFSTMAHKYGFEPITLQAFIKKFPDAQEIVDQQTATDLEVKTNTMNESDLVTGPTNVEIQKPATTNRKSPEQHKLEVANAVNDILSKRILKSKGNVYDDIENEVRAFLNSKLGKLLGGGSGETSLNSEEVKFYKEMYKRAIDKGAK